MNLIVVFLVSLAAFLLVVGLMAVGVLMGRREIRGSCGGLGQGGDADAESKCSLCSNPEAACRELSKRQQSGNSANSGAENSGLAEAYSPASTRDYPPQ
jgi:hypothetical protein